MIQLRPYQHKGIKMLYDSIEQGYRKICWVFPTGAGKSTVCSRFVKACVANDKRVLFFVHSKELVQQFADRLSDQFNIPCGVIMSGVNPSPKKRVQVASIQTLVRRKCPVADVVIIDECHHAKAKSYTKVLSNYEKAIIVGLTATPFRTDGKGLQDIFDTIVHPVKIRQLIKDGHLVGTKVFGPEAAVDLTGIKTIAGDYSKTELYEKYSDLAVMNGIIKSYKKNAQGKKAVVFNINVKHSEQMNQMFLDNGIPSACIDGKTPKNKREQIVSDFKNGKILVLNNIGVFTEGFDVPDTECVILNRATKSHGLYVQMVGRGLRPAPGKSHCIVLDHGGNTFRFMYVEDYDSAAFTLEDRKKKRDGDAPTRQCPECGEITHISVRVCECGYEFPLKEESVRFGEDKDIVFYGRDAVMIAYLKGLKYKKAAKKLPLSQLRIFELLKGYSNGWWFHNAVDENKVDVSKEQPNAWGKVKMLVELQEIEAETHDLYKKLKAFKKEGKVKID